MRITLIALLTLGLTVPALAAERVERPVATAADASDITGIVIEIPSSAIVVNTAAEKAVRVTGTASRTYRGEHNADAATRLLEDARVIITRRGRTLYVDRDLGSRGSRFWNSPSATQFNVTITVPAGMPVEVNQNAGTVDLAGSFGDLDVKLGAGDLTLVMPGALLAELDAATTVGELKTDLGTRLVEKSGVMAGSATFVSSEGTAKVRLRVRAGALDVKLTD